MTYCPIGHIGCACDFSSLAQAHLKHRTIKQVMITISPSASFLQAFLVSQFLCVSDVLDLTHTDNTAISFLTIYILTLIFARQKKNPSYRKVLHSICVCSLDKYFQVCLL